MIKVGEPTQIKISELKRLPTPNPNKMLEENFESLKNGIKEYGFVQPIVVYKDKKGFVLVDGEHRVKAMAELGEDTIQAIICPSKDKAEAVARILRLSLNNNRGQPKVDLLSQEVIDLNKEGFDVTELTNIGISQQEIQNIIDCADFDIKSLFKELETQEAGDGGGKQKKKEVGAYKVVLNFESEQERERVVSSLRDINQNSLELALLTLLDQ